MARPTHQFSQTKTAEIPRSSFDLSHGLKTTFDAGELVPILSLEILPADTISCRASIFARMATLIKPVLENLYCETFFFFVPYRQLWTNWVKFMGEQVDPGDSIDFTIPQVSLPAVLENTLEDYLGIPISSAYTPDLTVSAFPFRAYNSIFNFWFRDENLIPSVPQNTGDGPDAITDYSIQRRRKRRDYITSGLPFPQKGAASTVDLGGLAPITGIGLIDPVTASGGGTGVDSVRETGGLTEYGIIGGGYYNNPVTAGDIVFDADSAGAGAFPAIYADLGQAGGFTINELRESFQIQKLLERDARGGTRYPEILRSHFRVSDPGLLIHQRPVFLGGGSTMINVTPVSQTTPEDQGGGGVETFQANLAAYATISANNHGFTYSATEHGHIIGLINVRADLTYQQGLERYWNRLTRYDFYFPVLSHLGEQTVLRSEVFLDSDTTSGGNADVFAYMPRYDEYRFKQSQITGLFRSAATDSLDVWHLAQDFATAPTLSQDFIEDKPPIDRVVAVPSEPDYLLDVYFKIRAARPLPLYATPGLIDHF